MVKHLTRLAFTKLDVHLSWLKRLSYSQGCPAHGTLQCSNLKLTVMLFVIVPKL